MNRLSPFAAIVSRSPRCKRNNSRFGITAAVFFLIGLITSCSSGDNKNKGPDETAARKRWEISAPGEIYYASPALSTDEMTVYTGTSTWLTGTHGGAHYFLALNAATGSETWRFPLGSNEVRSTPAVAADGSIYFTVEIRQPATGAASGDKLFHVSATGDSLWTYDINPTAVTLEVGQSSPTLGPDGTVYVAGDRLYAISSGGTLRWTVLGPASEALRNAPVIGSDGTVYFVYHNIPLTALRPADGSTIWSTPLGVNDHCIASPAIGADGTIYVCTQPGLVYAVSSSGVIAWTFSLSTAGFTGTLRSSPAVDLDGSIYFGVNNGSPSSALFALNPDGSLKWIFEPANLPDDVPSDHFDIYSSPALGSDSILYFGQEIGRVYALNKADGSLKWLAETTSGITWSSPAIDRGGSLFISDISGRVYRFQTDSHGLDSTAAWPKFRYNNQNTGYKSR